MNFHTRTILDILILDTDTRKVFLELINSERKLWKKTSASKKRKKSTTSSAIDNPNKYVVSKDKLEKLDTALFSLEVKPLLKSELTAYLKNNGVKFLHSINLSWLAKSIDIESIDYVTFITEITKV